MKEKRQPTVETGESPIGSVCDEQELAAIRDALTNRKESLSWGREVAEFEQAFARRCGAKYAVALSSCTAALDLCAQILRLSSGDEVVTTPQTHWSTVSALVARGVTLRFADVEPDTLNIDPATIEPLVTSRTKAIYVVHYGGNPTDLDALRSLARRHSLVLVEDCAHAAGAQYKGSPIGNGDLCCFSFHSLKNMTTLGEGGMVTTSDSRCAGELRQLRAMGVVGKFRRRSAAEIGPYRKPPPPIEDHSFGSWDFDVEEIHAFGSNYRMTAIAAVAGTIQLNKLDGNNAARRAVAAMYRERLSAIAGVETTRAESTSSWHLFTCFLTADVGVARNAVLAHMLKERSIGIVLRYFPLHLTSVLRSRGHVFGECPVCEKVWFERQINLPIGPTMSETEVDLITDALRSAMMNCR